MNASLIALWKRKGKVFGTTCSKSVTVLAEKYFRTKGSGTIIHKVKYSLFTDVWHREKRETERMWWLRFILPNSVSLHFTSTSFCAFSCARFLRGPLGA